METEKLGLGAATLVVLAFLFTIQKGCEGLGAQASCERDDEQAKMLSCVSRDNHIWTEKGACIPKGINDEYFGQPNPKKFLIRTF